MKDIIQKIINNLDPNIIFGDNLAKKISSFECHETWVCFVDNGRLKPIYYYNLIYDVKFQLVECLVKSSCNINCKFDDIHGCVTYSEGEVPRYSKHCIPYHRAIMSTMTLSEIKIYLKQLTPTGE